MEHPERVVPDEAFTIDYLDHLARYRYAQPWSAGREVLDCGCGNGYGSHLLAETARSVTGVDIAAEAVAYARQHFVRPNLHFMQMDSQSLEFADATFDVVCSFEVVEHIADSARYLAEIRRVLRPEGTALLSTPNRLVYSHAAGKPLNPYHVREYSLAELRQVLAPHFSEVEIWGEFEDKELQVTKAHVHRWRLLWHSLDRWGVRRFLPSRLKRNILATAVKASGGDVRAMSERNMIFTQDKLETAAFFLVVAR